MDKDKPPPVGRSVEEMFEDFWRRRALTEKEQREERSPATNESILNSESEDEDEDEDNDGDDDEDEDDDDDEDNYGDDEMDGDDDDDEEDDEEIETKNGNDDVMDEEEEDDEEIETKNGNDDVMDEEEEENGKAFCRACGNNDGADEFWIWCDICKKRFHGNCVKFTPALEEEQKKCPLCRART